MNSPNCRPACFRGRVACGLCELLLILLGDFHVLLYFLEVSFIAVISLNVRWVLLREVAQAV